MKTTKTATISVETEIAQLTNDHTLLIKVAIGLFTIVLNICCINLFFF